MHFAVTFRHMDATEALKAYAHDKLEKLNRYFREPISVHVTLSCERGHTHVADLVLQLKNGIIVKATERTEDMYSSIDLAAAKIERQIRKWKDRIRDHKPHTAPDEVPVRHLVFQSGPSESEAHAEEAAATPPAAAKPPGVRVVETSSFVARPMSIDEAVMHMELQHNDFLVFMNRDSGQVSVVYRRKEGDYGLIETGAKPAQS